MWRPSAAFLVVILACQLAGAQGPAKGKGGGPPGERDDELFGKIDAKPTAASEPLGGPRKTIDNAGVISLVPLELPAEKLLDTIVYSKDGKHVFLATTDGVIRKVTVPELVEVARLAVGSCGALAMSKAGLVACLNATQRILVIDDETLAIKKQVHVAGATYVTCAPQTNLAVACSNKGKCEELQLVDLAKGQVTGKVEARQVAATRPATRPQASIFEFLFPTLTPDGKYLFVCSGECLHRLAVKGNALTLEESTPRIGQNPQGIEVSVDSKYVALPSGGGNYAAEGHPNVGYGTYLYAVGNLQTPKIGISTGAFPRQLALDPVAKLIYAQNIENQLVVLNTGGVEEGKYRLVPNAGEVREFALHPAGRQMLVLMERALVWLEWRKP